VLQILIGFALAFAPATPPPPVQQAPAVHVPTGLPKGMTFFREKANDPDMMAAWNANEAYVSTNGGAKFERVVHSPRDVRDVKFDLYGRMVVLVASLPDHAAQILGDGPAGSYVVTTAFDADVP
jgi:hypothetical protein